LGGRPCFLPPGVTNRQFFNLLPAPGVHIPHILMGMDPEVLGDAEIALIGGLP
jgi:hypothetical protein